MKISQKSKLRFQKNEPFRILCVSDIHGGVGYDEPNTVRYLNDVLEQAKPDLVLLLGDIAGPGYIHIETAAQLKTMLDGLTAPLEQSGIPWAFVFGNHDDNFGLPNDEAARIDETYPHCLSVCDGDSIGDSDYVIPIYDEAGKALKFCVYCFDSHGGEDDYRKRYGLADDMLLTFPNQGGLDSTERGVDFAQVADYWQTSAAIEKANGHTVTAMAVMHVPLQELGWASVNRAETDFQGVQGEDVSCQGLNSGLFRAFLERGDVKAVCFGHDHENNVTAVYGGVLLANDGYLSCHASHTKETLGGRLFTVDPNDLTVTTAFINARM